MSEIIAVFSEANPFYFNGFREKIVRCGNCKKRLPKGYKFDKHCNEAVHDACNLFSNHDFDFDYTHFFYVDSDNFCAWGEREEDEK